MNLEALAQKLIRAARNQPLSEEVPYLFEQRVMARIRAGRSTVDPWLVWAQGLWRAALPCLALLALVATWHWQHPAVPATELAAVSDDLEVAAVDAVDLSETQEDAW